MFTVFPGFQIGVGASDVISGGISIAGVGIDFKLARCCCSWY